MHKIDTHDGDYICSLSLSVKLANSASIHLNNRVSFISVLKTHKKQWFLQNEIESLNASDVHHMTVW